MKIRIKEIDEEEDPEFGGRILKVDKKFLTPYRVPSSVDYGSKQKLPTPIKIDSEISEVTTLFWAKEYEPFLTKNGPFKSRLAKVESDADIMAYSPLVSFYPQLPKNLPNNILPDENAMKLLLELGLSAENVNIIAIPEFEPIKSYEQDLRGYCNYIRSRGCEPMPILDMELPPDEFKKKFDTIVSNEETDLVKAIGLVYRNWSNNIQNYLYVWQNRDKPVLYYCLGVLRDHRKAATMHILQSFGIDVFSTRFMRGGGGEPKKLRNVDIFDKANIGVLKYNEFNQEHPDGHMNCNCPICQGGTIEEFKQNYGYNHNGEFDGFQLQYAGKVHEFFSSSNEFDKSRKSIEENSLLDYFSSKEYLKPHTKRN